MKQWEKDFDRRMEEIQRELENPVGWGMILFLLWIFSPFLVGIFLMLMGIYL